MEAGADVNIKGHMEFTSLHWGADKGYIKCVKMLISIGTDVNTRNKCG